MGEAVRVFPPESWQDFRELSGRPFQRRRWLNQL